MSGFKKGDRVRVTLEGEVKDVLTSGAVALHYDGEYVFVQPPEKVEKIEPPVEVFGPGDFVRDPESGQVFLLIEDGYVQVKPTIGQANPLTWPDQPDHTETFTSENYERVDVAEVPF